MFGVLYDNGVRSAPLATHRAFFLFTGIKAKPASRRPAGLIWANQFI
jgi:hypothetical protein